MIGARGRLSCWLGVTDARGDARKRPGARAVTSLLHERRRVVVNMRFRSLVLVPGLVAACLLAAWPTIAVAQTQSSAQAKCIVGVNAAIAKVASRQQRQVSSCVGDVLDG